MADDPISSAHRTRFEADQITPKDLKLKRAEQELHVTWKDGRSSIYSARLLRKNCPCATCRTERERMSRELLPVFRNVAGPNITLTSAQLVGAYALQLFWSDGHSTGIYDYKYLRSLDDGAAR